MLEDFLIVLVDKEKENATKKWAVGSNSKENVCSPLLQAGGWTPCYFLQEYHQPAHTVYIPPSAVSDVIPHPGPSIIIII